MGPLPTRLIIRSRRPYRFTILSTSYIIPQYLTTVQGYRAIEVGSVLVWIALPQFVLAPLTAKMLRFMAPRFLTAVGFALIGVACFMAGQLTDQWIGDDFLPSQIVQAFGQSIGLTSLVWLTLQQLDPSQTFTFGAVLQTGRLFGAEIGTAFVQTIIRVREQVRSNLIGLHVSAGSLITDGPAAGLCPGRGRALGRPARRQCARDPASRPFGADPGECAGLYRRLHSPP